MNLLNSISFGRIVQIREQLLKRQALGQKVYRLESGDPSFSLAPHVAEALQKALQDEKTHYVPNNGIPELRTALVHKLFHQNKIKVTSDDIFVTNGAMHALYIVFQCLLEPGDEVIVPEPLWTEISDNIHLAGGTQVSVPLTSQNGYQYTALDILNKVTSRTKVIFINSPHNPTGAVISKQELQNIAQIATQRGLWLICDEAYEDLIYDNQVHYSPTSDLEHYDQALSLYSFSKSHAMSGLRVGYIVTTHKMLKERIPKLLRCTVNGINSLAQWAALAAVTGSSDYKNKMLATYTKRRHLLYQTACDIPGLLPFKPQGAFYLWCEVSPHLLQNLQVKSVSQLSDLLAERYGLGSAPGECFGSLQKNCLNSLRFAFSCHTDMLEESCQILKTIFLQK